MGRKKKYFTLKEKRDAQNSWSKKYYDRNKDLIDQKAKEKYYELRKNLQLNNRKSEE